MMLIGAEHECIPGFRRYSVSSSKVTDMEPLATNSQLIITVHGAVLCS